MTDFEVNESEGKYVFHFNALNDNWNRTPEYNLLFVRVTQDHFNNLVEVRGHVFLNEVLDALGFSRISDGQKMGWLQKDGDPVLLEVRRDEEDSNAITITMLGMNKDPIWERI